MPDMFFPMDNMSTRGLNMPNFNVPTQTYDGQPLTSTTPLESSFMKASNDEKTITNQEQISKLTDFNEELKRLNDELTKLTNQERDLLLQKNLTSSQKSMDEATVEYWVKYIEDGNPPPAEPNAAYL